MILSAANLRLFFLKSTFIYYTQIFQSLVINNPSLLEISTLSMQYSLMMTNHFFIFLILRQLP